MKPLTFALTLVVALLQGCATVAVDRAKDLAKAAISYADATVAVIDVAIDSAINGSSEPLVLSAPRKVAEAQHERRAKDLEERDADLVKTISLYTTLKNSVNTTKAYFIGLQALANGSPAEAAGDAVQSLARRVNDISDALENHPSAKIPKLTDGEITALGGLARAVAAQVHGAIVADVLRKDAPTIGRALVLQERVLKEASSEIAIQLRRTNTLFYHNRVVVPYQTGAMDSSWVDDRRLALKVRALGETHTTVGAAQAASAQMQTVWRRILAGEYSAQEITASLKDTEDLLGAVNMLKAAHKAK